VDELRDLLDTLPGLIWTALPDGHADFFNAPWCEYTGTHAEDAKGQGWQTAIHIEDRPFVVERCRHSAATGSSFEMEARLRRADGDHRWFVIRARFLPGGEGKTGRVCAIASDIDDRRRTEQALRGLRLDLSDLCESIPAPLCTLDPSGKVEVVNRPLLEYFGKTAEELRRWGTIDAVHPDDLPQVISAHTNAVLGGTPYEVEHRCRRADGVYRWFLVRSLPVRTSDGIVVSWFVLLTDIEDRKRAEEATRASERNLNLIVSMIPTLAWSALPDGSADFVNRHFLDYIGMTLEQAKGWGWLGAVHADDLAGLTATWQEILASAEAGDAEARLRRTDGEYRWFLFRAYPVRDEAGQIVKWYGSNTDIDDRKRAEDELKRNQRFLAEGQRMNRTGTFAWRLDPDEITFSDELCRIFELDPPLTLEKILGRVHEEDVPLVAEKVALARQGVNDHEYECRLRMPDGSTRYLRTNAFGTRDRDGRLEYIGAMQDVTERRLSEEALGKVRSELAHMTRVASLGALTASIAHEVNQPLAGIITNANTCLRMLAAESPNIEGARETTKRTIRDGHRASDVITRLRALFAKKDAVTERLDLNEAAQEVIALSRSELQRARVVLHSRLAEQLPAVFGDRVQLQQVILNLLLNAAAAMSGVDERPREVFVETAREDDDRVRLTVRDTGVGLDPQTMERLFEAFYTTKSDGTGLGLYVSRSIIESHQGRLSAKSNAGPGAAFWFSIPCASPA
jgi:PAS domain S-box-containing protein